MLDALLSGGLSLISGLGSRQSAKKQQKLQAAYEYVNKVRQEEQTAANERNFQFAQDANREMHGRAAIANSALGKAMVERASGRNIIADAELAGFNPTTWLTTMGGMYANLAGMGYEMQQVVPFQEQAFQGSAYMMNAPTAQVPSMMEVVGNAATAGFNTLRSDYRVQQQQDFQREMLWTQLDAQAMRDATRGTGTFFGSGQIPYRGAAGGWVQRIPSGKVELAPGSYIPKAESTGVTNVWGGLTTPSGLPLGWRDSGRFPDAQAVGQAIGDENPLVSVYGTVVRGTNWVTQGLVGKDADEWLWSWSPHGRAFYDGEAQRQWMRTYERPAYRTGSMF